VYSTFTCKFIIFIEYIGYSCVTRKLLEVSGKTKNDYQLFWYVTKYFFNHFGKRNFSSKHRKCKLYGDTSKIITMGSSPEADNDNATTDIPTSQQGSWWPSLLIIVILLTRWVYFGKGPVAVRLRRWLNEQVCVTRFLETH
jgi:hypothetical protein